MFEYTEILEVYLFAFAYRLFHEDFSPIYRARRFERNLHETVCKQMQINKLLESLYIKLPIEHSTTCDSRTNLNYMFVYTSEGDKTNNDTENI